MKTTLATIKSFIRKNEGNLFLKLGSSFDGMADCVMPVKDNLSPVQKTENNLRNTLGLSGAWFVGSSRDYFSNWEDSFYIGYEVSNCCGRFVIAKQKVNV